MDSYTVALNASSKHSNSGYTLSISLKQTICNCLRRNARNSHTATNNAKITMK